MFETLSADEQLAVWRAEATDPRPRAGSGWPALDGLLRKQSFGPGTLVFLGGRMHTRKTAVMVNLLANMLKQGVPCGLVGLDEGPHMYVSKLASAITGTSHVDLDDQWTTLGNQPYVEAEYRKLTDNGMLSFTAPSRPNLDELGDWLEYDGMATGEPKRVVFIDYLSLLVRGQYDGKDTTRIPRLCEDLKMWANKHEVVVIALHQVGRQDDNIAKRYHGSAPITPEQLMYGGEQQADIILATYRPSLDPEGNMSQEEAISQGLDLLEWQAKADRVTAFQQDTMLQLIKNRPGVELNHQGIRLRSVGTSQKMEVVP